MIRGPLRAAITVVHRRSIALLTLPLLALGGQTVASQGASARTVTLKDISFSPEKLSITKGTKVTFAFRDEDTPHNVISRGRKRFKNIGTLSSGSRARTFRSAGTYSYSCTLHPGMSGRIVVR